MAEAHLDEYPAGRLPVHLAFSPSPANPDGEEMRPNPEF